MSNDTRASETKNRTARIVAGIVALLVFAAAALFTWRAFGSGARPASEPGPAIEQHLWPGLVDGFNELPTPPSALEGRVQAWTGRELILWGGNTGDGINHSTDGYAFDAETLAWRRLPASPLSPRSWAAGVWTGHELVIWGGSDGTWPGEAFLGDGAAYDSATDSWRGIAPAPVPANAPIVSVWTGDELVVWGTYRSSGLGTGAAYDPAAEVWRSIPDPPIPLNEAATVWTGEELIAFGAKLRTGNAPDTRTAVGAAYDPDADRWREIARSELDPNARTAVWNGTEMVAVDYGLRSAGYDPLADAWKALPRLPFNMCEGYLEIATADGIVLVQLCGEIGSLEPGDERWHVVLGRGQREPLGSGYPELTAAGRAFLIVALDRGQPRLWAYAPGSTASEAGPTTEDAWDVAAVFGALRSHYPYDTHIPDQVSREMGTLLSAEGFSPWGSTGRGLRPLWNYYPGFEVVDVRGPLAGGGEGARFEAVVRYNGLDGGWFEETIVLAPGVSLDGSERDLVVVDARPCSTA